MAGNSLVLGVEIIGEFKKLTAATQGSAKDLSSLNKTVTSVSRKMRSALAGIGIGLSFAIITRELKEATQAAIEDEKSQALLANQMRNTTGATDDQIASVEKQISKLQLTASVADDKLRPAYSSLYRVTKDSTESMKLLNIATDISASTGKDLGSVTLALTKAYQGKMGALQKLGVPMTDSIQNAQDYAKATATLNKLTDLAATQSGPALVKTQEKIAIQQAILNDLAKQGIDWQGDLGKAFQNSATIASNLDPYTQLKIAFDEIQESVGAILLPILRDFADWLLEITPKIEQFFRDLTDPTTEMGAQWAAMWEMIGMVGDQFDRLLSVMSGGRGGFAMVMDWITTMAAGLGQLMFYFSKLAEQQQAFWSGNWGKSMSIAQNYTRDYNNFVTAQQSAYDIATRKSQARAQSFYNNIKIEVNGANVTANDIVNTLNKSLKTNGSLNLGLK